MLLMHMRVEFQDALNERLINLKRCEYRKLSNLGSFSPPHSREMTAHSERINVGSLVPETQKGSKLTRHRRNPLSVCVCLGGVLFPGGIIPFDRHFREVAPKYMYLRLIVSGNTADTSLRKDKKAFHPRPWRRAVAELSQSNIAGVIFHESSSIYQGQQQSQATEEHRLAPLHVLMRGGGARATRRWLAVVWRKWGWFIQRFRTEALGSVNSGRWICSRAVARPRWAGRLLMRDILINVWITDTGQPAPQQDVHQ